MVLRFHQCLQTKYNLCIDSGKVAMYSFIVLCFLVSEKMLIKLTLWGYGLQSPLKSYALIS